MQKHDVYFWIAQGLSLVSLGVFVFSWSKNTRKETLKLQIIGNCINISVFLLLGAYTGMLMSVTTLTRNIIYKQKGKKEWIEHPLLMYAFMAALVAGTLYSWIGPITLLPCIACLLGTYAISLENTIAMKRYIFIACALWIPYNLWVMAYVAALGNFILCVSVWVFLQKEKQRHKQIKTI